MDRSRSFCNSRSTSSWYSRAICLRAICKIHEIPFMARHPDNLSSMWSCNFHFKIEVFEQPEFSQSLKNITAYKSKTSFYAWQVYRLHQLNRAAQLVTALSFTVRGAEMTAHNMAINNSLGTLLNVLQCLGVICIWSLSSFLMRFFPSSAVSAQ